ncbi:MAG: hypothetical protein QXL44_06350, partial [Candidatus Nitrosocaldus sp.]
MVKGFVNALLISGIKIGRVVSYVQFSYEILKIIYELYRSSNSSSSSSSSNNSSSNSNNNGNRKLEDLTREDIDRIAGVIVNRKGWSNATIAIALR